MAILQELAAAEPTSVDPAYTPGEMESSLAEGLLSQLGIDPELAIAMHVYTPEAAPLSSVTPVPTAPAGVYAASPKAPVVPQTTGVDRPGRPEDQPFIPPPQLDNVEEFAEKAHGAHSSLSTGVILAIVLPIVTLVFLLALCVCMLHRRMRHPYQDSEEAFKDLDGSKSQKNKEMQIGSDSLTSLPGSASPRARPESPVLNTDPHYTRWLNKGLAMDWQCP